MKVLLGFGGSQASLEALERTVDRAVAAGDELTVALAETEGASHDELADRVEDAAEGTGLSVDLREIEGNHGSELVALAESEGFDELVLGSNTTSPMGKITLNKTAEFVLLNSHVTVTLVR